MRKPLFFFVTFLTLTACASIANWEQPGKTPMQTAQDKSECEQIAKQAISRSSTSGQQIIKDYDQESAFADCMRQRGYQEATSKPDNGVDR